MGNEINKQRDEFRRRFIAVCGTSNARVISEYLGISYQAAKNYLNGRLPESKVLIRIAEKTPCSLHWLLTGEGEKYVDFKSKSEAELLATVLSDLADTKTLRKIFEVLSEEQIRLASGRVEESSASSPRIFKIRKDTIHEEKKSESHSFRTSKKSR